MGSRGCPSPGSAVERVSGGGWALGTVPAVERVSVGYGLWGPSQRGGGVTECSGLRRSGGKGESMGDEIAALPSALPRGPAFGVSMETEAPCGQATVHGGAGWAKWGTRTPGKWRALADFV
ncbi:unnamed protein product [Lepidochelys olivacea]